MRALLGFTLGFALSGALWLYLDLQTRPAAGARVAIAPAPARRAPSLPAPPSPTVVCASTDDELDVEPFEHPPSGPIEGLQPLPVDEAPPDDASAPTDDAVVVPSTWKPERRLPVFVALGLGGEAPVGDGVPGPGSMVGVRVLVEPTEQLGLELELLGTVGRDYASRTVQTVAKWHPVTAAPVRPYAALGLGWRRFYAPESDVLVVPLGAGLDYRRGPWFADGRVMVRSTPGTDRHTAAATAHVGYTF